jgi:hypothetical protein
MTKTVNDKQQNKEKIRKMLSDFALAKKYNGGVTEVLPGVEHGYAMISATCFPPCTGRVQNLGLCVGNGRASLCLTPE